MLGHGNRVDYVRTGATNTEDQEREWLGSGAEVANIFVDLVGYGDDSP